MKISKKTIIILVLIILYSVIRLSVLFTSLDLYNFEENYRYSFPMDIINGLRMPLLKYQYTAYEGGSIITALTTVPFLLLFGTNYIVIKLQPFFLNLFVILLYFFFLSKFFNKKIAFIASLFFIFSPFIFTHGSLVNMGAIQDAEIFRIAALFLFYKIIYSDTPIYAKSKTGYFVLLGLLSGLGVYFSYTSLIMTFFILLLWFSIDKKFFLNRYFAYFSLSFIPGLLPFIYYNLTYSFSSFYTLQNGLNNILGKFGFMLMKFFHFFVYDLADSFNFKSFYFINSQIFNYLYYIMFLSSFIFLIFRFRKELKKFFTSLFFSGKRFLPRFSKEAPILIYPLFFILVYAISNYFVGPPTWNKGYRYFYPIYPFIFIILSFSIYYFHKAEFKRRLCNYISISAFSIILLFGIISNVAMININNSNLFMEKTPFYKGDDHIIKQRSGNYTPDYFLITKESFGYAQTTLEQDIYACSYLSDLPVEECYDFLLFYMVEIKPYYSGVFSEFNQSCSSLDSDIKSTCYYFLGRYLRYRSKFRHNPDDISFDYCEKIDKAFLDECRTGFIYAIPAVDVFSYNEYVKNNRCDTFPEFYKKICYEKLINETKMYFSFNQKLLKQKCNFIPEEFKYLCYDSDKEAKKYEES